jgi:hypothetical protein
MKNLFEIDSDEIKRILSLHETSTKEQYLNVLTEQLSQSHDSYKLLSNVELENNTATAERNLKLYKGAVFVKSKKAGHLESNTTYGLITNLTGQVSKGDNKKGTVYYNCKTAKFFIPGFNYSWYEDTYNSGYQKTLTGSLKQVCNSKKGEFNTGGGYSIGNGTYTIPKNTKFIKTTGGASFKAMKVFKVQPSSIPMASGFGYGVLGADQSYPVDAFFSCKDLKFYIEKQALTEDKGSVITTKLKQLYCDSTVDPNKKTVDPNKKVVDPKLEKAQKCGHKSWEEYKNSNWACTPTSVSTDTNVVDTSKLTPKEKEYYDKVTNINKQIQAALGIKDGNGTLSQADYQTIYNKLLQ